MIELKVSQKVVEEQVIECVDRGLSVLGDGVKVATLWHIEHTYHVKVDEVVKDPDKFVGALNKMFGAASKILLSLILKEIKKTFGDIDGDDLVATIRELKESGKVKMVKEITKDNI